MLRTMSLLTLLNPQPSGLAALRVGHGEIETKKIETSAIGTAVLPIAVRYTVNGCIRMIPVEGRFTAGPISMITIRINRFGIRLI